MSVPNYIIKYSVAAVFVLSVSYAEASPLKANPVTYSDIRKAADYSSVKYIDPQAADGGDGTLEHPLNSWDRVSFADNTAYLQKYGTIGKISVKIAVKAKNVLLGAYGDSSLARPVISAPSVSHIVDFQGESVTIRDFEIVSTGSASGVRSATWAGAKGGTVYNCYIHGTDQQHNLGHGVRIMGFKDRKNSGVRVLRCRIEYIADDGIFIQNAENVEIGYNRITKVNQNWFNVGHTQGEAGGDGVQFDGLINGYHVHHNYVDRSDTGNKFCVIANTSGANVKGLIENNYLIAPVKATAIYLGWPGGDNYRPTVRNNYICCAEGSQASQAIYSHATYSLIYNNVFNGNFQNAIAIIKPTEEARIDHNTFVNMKVSCIYDGYRKVIARNNIFAVDKSKEIFNNYPNNKSISAANNLFVSKGQAMGEGAVVGVPGFVDSRKGRFHLKKGSPAVNTGVAIPEIKTDAYGNARDAKPDIGAFEMGRK